MFLINQNIASEYWSLLFIHFIQMATPRRRNVTRQWGILTAIVRYLEATDNVADDFFNGLLKLSKFIDPRLYIIGTKDNN